MSYFAIGRVVGFVVGGVTFIGCWIGAVSSYGFLLGGGLGWIPAMFIGLVAFGAATVLWPLLAVLVLLAMKMAYGA